MWKYYDTLLRSVSHFELEEWLIVLVGVVIVGYFCLQGMGSRSNY